MKFTFVFFLVFFLQSAVYSQFKPSVSNLFRYGSGDQKIGDLNKELEYTENILDFRLQLPASINVGFRYIYDDPPEIGPTYKGFKRRFIEYNKSGLSIRAGHSSEVFGKGLVLNLFEDRGLVFNTWMDGLKAGYTKNNFKVIALAGKVEFTDPENFSREEKYNIYGGNLEYSLVENLSAGVSYIRAVSDIPQLQEVSEVNSDLPEFYLSYNSDNYEVFLNYALKSDLNKTSDETIDGHGIYGSFSYFDEGVGFTLDYKDYRFNFADPFRRYDNTRTDKLFPFQNPPIVMKEHSYKLLSRPLHEVDFNDEVGLQLEVYYLLNDEINFTFNTSLASRHNYFSYNLSSFSFSEEERNSNFLPSLDDEYSPYYELYLESEYTPDFNSTYSFGIAFRKKVLFSEITGDAGTHKISSLVFPVGVSKTFSNDFSAQLKYQLEFRDDNFNVSQKEFNNQYLYLLSTLFQKMTLTLRYEFTNNDFDISGRKDWFSVEAGYKFTGSILASVTYGRERGGLVCVNGVCRYLLPFKGFRFSLQTIF